MNNPSSATIAVIGTAIAGLSSAIGAANANHHVSVFGHVPARLQGALQLAPNGFAALHALGAYEPIRPSLTRLSAIELRSARTNSCLSVIDHENPTQRDYASIGRDALYQALLSVAQAHPLISFHNQMVTALHITKDETNLTTQDGSTHHFDLIIGADGKDGIARHAIAPHSAPTPITRQALRTSCNSTALPRPFGAKRTQLWLGDGFHLVSYPFEGGAKINLVLCTASTAYNSPDDIVRRLTANTPILASLAQAGLSWHSTPLAPASQLATWRKFGLILTGDAAHFMPPHLAQGAGQTLEDAASLSHFLSQATNIEQAAAQWALNRSRSLAPVIERAEATGTIMRLSGPFARLRNFAIEIGGQRLIEQWLKQVWH